MEITQTILTIIVSCLASSGLWSVILKLTERKDNKTKMLLGLGHDRIIALCSEYLERGSITVDEYENLYKYLFAPYEAMGGNGTAKRMIEQVGRLPIRKEDNREQ